MPLQYVDLSERHGHRDDHRFERGAEFNVKMRRRVEIPDFVREKLSEPQIDELWWEEARSSKDALQDELQRRYRWVGELAFVGRGPGWLAIQDTGDGRRSRDWDAVGKIVERRLREFVSSMESADTWRDVRGIAPSPSPAPAAPASAKKSPAQLRREVKAVVGARGRRR